MIPWSRIHTVLLDLDGTLLDLRFDNYFWAEYLPACFAEMRGMPLEDAKQQLGKLIDDARGTLNWYCTDYWSEVLELDVIALKETVRERVTPRPGAEQFLSVLKASPLDTLLVTNAHPDTLRVKLERVTWHPYFDRIVSSHDIGHPKESLEFWVRFAALHAFDLESTVFIDDNEEVLDAAAAFGIQHLVTVDRPDSGLPIRENGKYRGFDHFAEIIPELS